MWSARDKFTKIEQGISFILERSFSKNPVYFRVRADFEADNETEVGKVVGNKTTNVYKQNPVLNGYYKISESENVLKSGSYVSPLGYKNVDW